MNIYRVCQKKVAPFGNNASTFYGNYCTTRMHSADYAVATCPSIRLSVCLFVCLSVCHMPVLCVNRCTYPQFFHSQVAQPF